MDRTRLFLAANALVWLGYGLYCLMNPGRLAEVAGVVATSATGTTELRAMYGGLQMALGVFAFVAVLRRDHERTVLLTIAFLTAGLFSGRLYGVFVDGGLSGYTAPALVLEISLTVLSVVLLRRRPDR